MAELIENKEAEKWLEEILKMDMAVKIGVLSNPSAMSGNIKSTDAKRRNGNKQTNTTVLDVAIVHEFGSPAQNIPERSFIRSTFDESEARIESRTLSIIRKEMKDGNPKPDAEKVFSLLGQWMVNLIQGKFRHNNWAPLKDPTRGGRNKQGLARPLIDTGQLRSSITFEIVKVPE